MTRYDYETSFPAWESIQATLGAQQRKVFKLIKKYKRGLTNEQIADKLNIGINVATPRRLELQEKGLIKPAGMRQTKSGRFARVWVAR